MAFQNVTSLSLGDILQIYFSDGMRLQISDSHEDWKRIEQAKVDDVLARQINFYLQKSLGPAAVQPANAGAVGAFPRGQQVSSSEHIAYLKKTEVTVSLPYDVWKRAEMSKEYRYAQPLEIEMESKLSAAKMKKCIELHGDGTGVLGQVGSTAQTVSSGRVWFYLNTADTARGHVGNFLFDDILILRAAAGSASAFDSNLATEPVYWLVVDRDFDNDRVLLQGLDASYANVTITSITTPAASTDVFYQFRQPTIPDLTSIADYGTAAEIIVGLDSLTASDARTVFGMVMTGSTKGSRFDCQDTAIDISHLEQGMNNTKINVGEDAYNWKEALMFPSVYSQFILGRETDRRFTTVEDTTRGAKKFAYIHRKSTIELTSSQFAHKKRFYVIPEAAKGQGKVLEYHGTDFMEVRAPGEASGFRLEPGSSGGFQGNMVSYMNSYGALICKHPAAVCVLHNYTIS